MFNSIKGFVKGFVQVVTSGVKSVQNLIVGEKHPEEVIYHETLTNITEEAICTAAETDTVEQPKDVPVTKLFDVLAETAPVHHDSEPMEGMHPQAQLVTAQEKVVTQSVASKGKQPERTFNVEDAINGLKNLNEGEQKTRRRLFMEPYQMSWKEMKAHNAKLDSYFTQKKPQPEFDLDMQGLRLIS